MSLKEALDSKRFAVTSEIYLPHDKSPEDYLDEIYNLRTSIDALRFQPFSAGHGGQSLTHTVPHTP